MMLKGYHYRPLSLRALKTQSQVATTNDKGATLLKYSMPMGSSHSQLPESSPWCSPPTTSLEGVECASPSTLRGPTAEVVTQAADARVVSGNIEEQGHTHTPTKKENAEAELLKLHDKLFEDLKRLTGPIRAERLYQAHVYRSHLLLVHGDGEREKTLAEKLQRCLKEKGQDVEGPWSLNGGDDVLYTWQSLSNRAVAVVVLLSPALFEDTERCRFLLEMRQSHPDTIVPLFLEPLSPQGLPPNLAFLKHINGRVVPDSNWDPHPFIRSLLEKSKRLRHICRKIKALNTLLDELEDSTDICPCGKC